MPTSIPTCQVNELMVQGNKIYNSMIGVEEDVTIILPQEYNAGICGGTCRQEAPQSSHHSTLIFLLLGEAAFGETHSYEIKQCCSPVKYKGLNVLFRTENGGSVINVINDMVIEECECLDIVDFGVSN